MPHILSDIIIQVWGVLSECNRYPSRAGVIQYSGATYIEKRSPSKYNGSCPNVRDLHIRLLWHNTLWHLLTNLGPVLSYFSHPFKLYHTHAKFVTPICFLPCLYYVGLHLHLHAPKPWPCSSSEIQPFVHLTIHQLTYSILSISSLCILLCSNSDPVHTYYVTPSTSSPSNFYYHWPTILTNIAVIHPNLKSHLQVCIWHVQILTSITTIIQLE